MERQRVVRVQINAFGDVLSAERLRVMAREIRSAVRTVRHPLVARYSCGHALEVAPRGDADTRCPGCPCGELLGLLARAA